MTTPEFLPDHENPRSPGRPRSSATDQAILENALRLFVEQGCAAMSVEAVAAAAGVTKPTIYRRYPSKRELVGAAIISYVDTFELPPDSGSIRSDMLNYFGRVYTGTQINVASIIGAMIVSEREEPALMDLLREQVISPRVQIAGELFRRGMQRGEIRSGIPIKIVSQMMIGSLIARHMWGEPEDETWLESLVDTLLQGLLVRPQ